MLPVQAEADDFRKRGLPITYDDSNANMIESSSSDSNADGSCRLTGKKDCSISLFEVCCSGRQASFRERN